jgi:hypothetical protein
MLHSALKIHPSMMEFNASHAQTNSILISNNVQQLQLEQSMMIMFMAMWFHKNPRKLILKLKMSYRQLLFFLTVQLPTVMPQILTMME